MGQRISRFLPEILVGTVAILIIAAIIFRTAIGGLDKANATSCLNNIHQIAQGIQMYCDDYNGLLPPGPYWHESIKPDASEKGSQELLRCPARPKDPGYGYGLNYLLALRSEQSVWEPSKVIALCDVYDSTAEIWWANDSRFAFPKFERPPVACHKGKAICAFLDGHAKTCLPGKLTRDNWIP